MAKSTVAMIFAMIFCLGIAACSRDALPAATTPGPTRPELPAPELMIHVIEPAARNFWKGWGEILDENGWRNVSPKSETDWKIVEDGAATLLIAGERLGAPDYARAPEMAWEQFVAQIIDIARRGKASAEKQDSEAMFELGEQLDAACDSCHAQFAPHVP